AVLCVIAYASLRTMQTGANSLWMTPCTVIGQMAAAAGAIWEAFLLNPAAPFAVPCWSLGALLWAGLYFALARRLKNADWTLLAGLPLAFGFAAYQWWRLGLGQAPPTLFDRHLADALWTAGFALAGWACFQTACWSKRIAYVSAGAVAFTGGYLYAL